MVWVVFGWFGWFLAGLGGFWLVSNFSSNVIVTYRPCTSPDCLQTFHLLGLYQSHSKSNQIGVVF